MNKKGLITVVLIAIVALVWWMMGPGKTQTPQDAEITETPEITEANVSTVEADLNGLDFGDIDAEFESLDADLNNL